MFEIQTFKQEPLGVGGVGVGAEGVGGGGGWGGWRQRGLGVEGVGVEGVGGRGWGMEEVEGHVSGALRNKDLEFHICKVHTHIRTQYI